MARYQYPSNLLDVPVQTRIAIIKRETVATGYDGQETETITNTTDEIYLYAPQGIQFSDGLAFDQVQLNNAVSTAVGALESNKSMATAAGEGLKDFARGVQSDLAGRGGSLGGAAAESIKRAGFIRNPRTELLFKTPQLRTFTLAYKFFPVNGKESADLEKLIRTIRAAAYPSVSSTGGQFFFPLTFNISFVSPALGVEPKIIKFADAYCTSVAVNYNPTNTAFFDDGSPAEIDLGLTFQETEVISRAMVEAGY